MEEKWIRIERYPKYEVSNQAEVRNARTKRNIAPLYFRKEDDHKVQLCGRNGKYKYVSLKRLVAEAFHDGQHDDCEVECIDGDLNNMWADNLRWVKRV